MSNILWRPIPRNEINVNIIRDLNEQYDKNIVKTREFNIDVNEINKNKTICKFFNSKMGCKNGNKCKFLHETEDNWRKIIKKELSPEEQLNEEVKFAISNGTLNDIFYKMVSSIDEYEKYYSILEWHFKNIVNWKSNKKSIKKELFDTLEKRDVIIDNGILPFGYIPLSMYFLFLAFSWKLFDGAHDYISQRSIEVYFDEVIDCVSTYYSFDEYKEIIKTMIGYVNPSNYATVGHMITEYFADKLMYHIKEQLSTEDFSTFLKEKTKKNQTMKDWFDFNNNDKTTILNKYKYKYEKEIKYMKNNEEKLVLAKQKYEYNLSTIDTKMKYFFDAIFNESRSSSPTFTVNIDYDKLFNTKLDKLLKSENKFGIPYDQEVMITLLNWIPMFYSNCIDEKINMILDKLPSSLFNCNKLIDQFKSYGYIVQLWNHTLSKITKNKPFSYCTELLIEFFKEEKKGIREAYIGEYFNKLTTIYEILNTLERSEFIQLISLSKLPDSIKVKFNH
jgi:uncharacterized protein YciU (UPF0263 family)